MSENTALSETDVSQINAVIEERGMTAALGPGQAYFYAAGRLYVHDTLMSAGVKEEGKAIFFFDSPRDAVEEYLKSLDEYLGNYPENSLVVWRAKPYLVDNGDGGASVYSRLTVI